MCRQVFILVFLSTLVMNLVIAQETTLVSTAQTKYLGYVVNPTTRAFLGIRFAETTSGNNRFKPPVDFTPSSSTVYNATTFGNVCIQESGDTTFSEPQDEDCLFLNVWSPRNISKSLPVFFWIHGGAFKYGSGNIYNGEYWVQVAQENNVPLVLVTFNYRLGVLGYMGDALFAAENGKTVGNFGMLDQLTAFNWVKNNIAYFGGDPNKITIGGESAGGVSTALHLVSPLTKSSDYRGAIIQSGYQLPWNMQQSKEEAQTNANNLKSYFGCSSLACLRGLNAQDIITYQANSSDEFKPINDGYFLNGTVFDLLNNGSYKKVNLLIGDTRNEMTTWTCGVLPTDISVTQQKAVLSKYFGVTKALQMYQQIPNYYTLANYPNNLAFLNDILSNANVQCNARYAISLASSAVYNTFFYTYDYHFSWVPSCLGTAHAAELPMQFPSTLKTRASTKYYSFNSDESFLSKQMVVYWSNFVVSGNPNKNSTTVNLMVDQTYWPRYSTCNDTQLIIQIQKNQVNNTMYASVCPFLNPYVGLPVLKCGNSVTPPEPQTSSSPTPTSSSGKNQTSPTQSIRLTSGRNGTAVASGATIGQVSKSIVNGGLLLLLLCFWW